MRRRKAEGDPRPPGVPRITPQDIQDKEFRLSFRGYNEREVDEFLDELTEAMAELIEENRRLRERAEAGAAAPGSAEAADDVLRRAWEEAGRILREAREQAERIVREAGERAAALAGPVGPEERRAIGAFVKREREFLQSLAALVQGHAEAVREMARRARERAEAAEAPPAGERAPAAPAEERPAPAPAAPSEGAPGPAASPAERPAGVAAAGARGEEPTIRVPEAEPEPAAEGSGPTGRGRREGGTSEAAEGPGPSLAERGIERPGGRAPSLRELFWGEEE